MAFTERNVAADEVALSELKEFGYMTTPVTVVDGDVVVGFNPSELEGLAEREAAASTTSGGLRPVPRSVGGAGRDDRCCAVWERRFVVRRGFRGLGRSDSRTRT